MVRNLIKKSTWLTCAYYLFDDWLAGKRLRAGMYSTTSGSRHIKYDLEESLNYINNVYADYLKYAGVSSFSGRIAEIGPGDNFGVALRILNDGGEEVHAIDRYRSIRNREHQRKIYKKLSELYAFSHLFDGEYFEENINGLKYISGCPAEEYFKEKKNNYDVILSRAVLEHLTDPLGALDDMYSSLRPGGIMIHRIDLRDHGMFAGKHPLTFLTIPKRIYKYMVTNSARPNRILYNSYSKWIKCHNSYGELMITRLVGISDELPALKWEEIEQEVKEKSINMVRIIKNRLTPSYRMLEEKELAIVGCVLVVKKPH